MCMDDRPVCNKCEVEGYVTCVDENLLIYEHFCPICGESYRYAV